MRITYPVLGRITEFWYKDSKGIIQTLRELHAENELNELQERVFNPTRPPEELYDLEKDPHETVNLADREDHRELLLRMRHDLYDWMIETRDLGLIPEPILEDMGRAYGHKYNILRSEENEGLVKRLIRVMEAGEMKDLTRLRNLLDSGNPMEKYWAATWLGLHKDEEARETLKGRGGDETPAVRIASCLALCRLGEADEYLPKLVPEITDPNHLVQMYAIRAIERTHILNDTVRKAAEIAAKSDYDNTTRYGRRLLTKFGESSRHYAEYKPERYEYLYQPYEQATPTPLWRW